MKEFLEETKQILKDLVEINTTNPPGNEKEAALYIRKILKKEKIEVKIFESSRGRATLWARLRGSGKKKPFMMMAHLDVVPASREQWKTDPFKVVEKGGYYYGRGVMDDKGMAAAGITVLKRLVREKKPLKRDVILYLGADEEKGGIFGSEWILKHHPELFNADAVINEGGPIYIEDGKITYLGFQNYEKTCFDLKLTTKGPSGHSSLPLQDNAIFRLAKAVEKIGSYPFPAKLNEVTRAYFEGLSKIPKQPLRKELKILLSQRKGKAYTRAVKKITAFPLYNACLRTTCVPTIINSGESKNTIPEKAEVNVNCRLLPTDNPAQVIRTLKKVVDDPAVTFSLENKLEKPVMSPFKHAVFGAVKKVMSEMAPDAVTIPYMTPGLTDSRRLRWRGINAYGLLPFPMTFDDRKRMHGNDERLSIKSLGFGVEFLYRLTLEYAG